MQEGKAALATKTVCAKASRAGICVRAGGLGALGAGAGGWRAGGEMGLVGKVSPELDPTKESWRA